MDRLYPNLEEIAGLRSLTGEYPIIAHAMDWDSVGHDDAAVFVLGMSVCVESFIGHEDSGEGVKLEEQVLRTALGLRLR